MNLFEKCTNLDLFTLQPQIYFHDLFSRLYDERKKDDDACTERGCKDLFQLLLDAVKESDNGMVGSAQAGEGDVMSDELTRSWHTPASERRRISKIELIAQAFIVIGAGFDTTGSTLQFMAYLLALNPDVQVRKIV